MEVDLEMLSEETHKIPFVLHVYVSTLTITHLWRKNLVKDADIMFTIPIVLACWPNSCREYLLCDIIFPIIRWYSWKGHWVVRWIIMDFACKEFLVGSLNIVVGRRSILGMENYHAAGIFFSTFFCGWGRFNVCLKMVWEFLSTISIVPVPPIRKHRKWRGGIIWWSGVGGLTKIKRRE